MRPSVFFVGTFAAISFAQIAGAQSPERGGSITVDGVKAVVVAESKSGDGRYALAWTPKEKDKANWSGFEGNPDGFSKANDADQVWVVNVDQVRKLDTLVAAATYIQPGMQRTLAATWAAKDDGGRRFGLAAYDWKWGTDSIYLLDVGAQDAKNVIIGPQLDTAVATFLKRTTPEAKAALNITYKLTGVPKTGFTDGTTVLVPFNARESAEDRPVAEGVLTLKLSRTGDTAAVAVTKVVKTSADLPPRPEDTTFAKADAEMNTVYSAVAKKLTGSRREKLKDEQRAWIAQRDKQAAEAPTEASAGAQSPRDRLLIELTQQRTAELRKALGGKAR